MDTRVRTRAAGQKRKTARGPLDSDQVLTAALRLVDAEGLDALSMRKLGAELGVEAMALYNHIADKEALLRGIADVLWREVEAAARPGTNWRKDLVTLGRSLRSVMHDHPLSAPRLLTLNWMPEPALRVLDVHLRALAAAGCPDDRAVEAVRAVAAFAIGWGLTELTWFGSVPPPDEDQSQVSRIQRLLSSLPAGIPAPLVEVALAVCDSNPGDMFESGLALIVRGLAAEMDARTGAPTPST